MDVHVDLSNDSSIEDEDAMECDNGGQPRPTTDARQPTPSTGRGGKFSGLELGSGEDVVEHVLPDEWYPIVSANDLPSDLREESKMLEQLSAASGLDATYERSKTGSKKKRLVGDTLDITMRPSPLKRSRRDLLDLSADVDALSPPLPPSSPWPWDQTHPRLTRDSNPEHAAAQSLVGRAKTVTDGRSNMADDVTAVRLPKGLMPVKTPSPGRFGGFLPLDDSGLRTPPSRVLQDIGIIELLDRDSRPTFIVDLSTSTCKPEGKVSIPYANESSRAHPTIRNLLATLDDEGEDANIEISHFKEWVLGVGDNSPSSEAHRINGYAGVIWSYVTLRNRFRVVSGSSTLLSTMSTNGPSAVFSTNGELVDGLDEPAAMERSATHSESEISMLEPALSKGTPIAGVPSLPSSKVSFDWTRIPLTDDVSEHIRFARSIDWASTPLGPIESWPLNLRVMANLIMASPHPAAIYWGPENAIIYNEAYIEIAGQKHPRLMGRPCDHAWTSTWDQLDPVFREARESGQAVMKYDDHIFVDRQGFIEEVYFTWSMVPVLDDEGEVVGVYNPAFENTRRRIGERRMLTLRRIGERIATTTEVGSFWTQVLKGLGSNAYDIPFALIYSAKDAADSDSSFAIHENGWKPSQLVLEGSLGFPANHPAAVQQLDLDSSDEGLAPQLRDALEAAESPLMLSVKEGTLPSSLLEGIEPRGFKVPCQKALILRLRASPSESDAVAAFVVLGLNPRRPYDDDFRLFINLLGRQLEISITSLTLLEEEVRRGRTAAMIAAQDKLKLSKQLIQRTQEAVESEYRFTRMAEFAPVGMFIADPTGFINYCNDMWWEISRHPRGDNSVNTWMESVMEEDRPEVQKVWKKLTEEKIAITHEFRFSHTRQNADQVMETWVLMSAYPEKDANGHVKSIFGCLTDISTQKWAEYSQKQRREEAVELKRQQENFIDITSHEMRNPLSAILQCADEVYNSIGEFRAGRGEYRDLKSLLDCCADAANTISFCASHQKRIVDDILTLSKLDSQLLMVTPVSVQPVAVVERVLKMFETELASRDILLEFRVEQPYRDYGIDWVRIDPSRLRQVVINLMTNAIKFTQNREQRVIVVSVSASKQAGENGESDVTYFPSQRENTDITKDEEWGSGEEVNLHFSVQDTGPGLTGAEIKVLFQRFSQASPRTHVQYGGSGLGLFISRILTELQGGQIGVSSTKGTGSTFTFYIKSRKTDPPPHDEIQHGENMQATVAAAPSSVGSPGLSNDNTSNNNNNNLPGLPEDSLRKMDVLIVEDNIVNQKVLQRQLRSYRCDTFVANHGGEALEKIRNSRFWKGKGPDGGNISVILMDLEMPVMDGMTCAKRIRELQRDGTITAHIPIIAVTAYARPQQIESAKSAGVDDVISKPFRLLELIPKIRELAERYGTLPPSSHK
ncbi:Uncharacterized protein SAPIO_CDS1433 [Scedosporium apiospermum]|uniref:Hsp90-like protein n=1 Tax=Pseudallescheria apiosperma TaxID=563466 RepID=A0A084GFB2_PSEDA|nr:Uncharacterized protein SAPIO_CDS1433 [Scedosporium apiospermum]KEZ46024.1 Uncharacterized protein SAPIO_CDS1433 [Scedosporium apiospermum]